MSAPDTWRVHVAGPDDVLPAESRLDAMLQAHAINTATLRLMQPLDDPMLPTVWASPIPPGVTA